MFYNCNDNIEKKSYDGGNFMPVMDLFQSLGWSDLAACQAWSYYKKIQPVGRSTNLSATEFSQGITPVLYDTKTKEYIKELTPGVQASQILPLLNKKANMNETGTDFKFSLGLSLIVTGETYIIVTGLNEPKELYWENPKHVSIDSGRDGYPQTYRVQKEIGSEVFTRNIDGRYFDITGLREIILIKMFNPDYSFGNLRGFSRLSIVYYEIEQYLHSNIHNLSLLEKGARPSGALTYDGEWTDTQREMIRSQLRNFYQGSSNTGNILVLEGGNKKEFKELSINNKDMDFVQLKKMVKDSIYENLEIPASFYDNSASTFNNKGSDKESLYDFNIIPLTNKIFDFITNFIILPRYKDGERYELTFIEEEVPALENRFLAQIMERVKAGVFTYNELRSMFGYESIGEEGDIIYQPMGLIPVGQDQYTQDNLKRPRKKSQDISFLRKELIQRGVPKTQLKEYEKWLY